jgi:uncharacterized membrane protein YkvA (DUF1232 family)
VNIMGNSKGYISKTLLSRVLGSSYFNANFRKASRLSQNSTGVLKLLRAAFQKMQEKDGSQIFKSVKGKVLMLAKLLTCYAKGDYRDIELKNLVIIIAAFLYFISPIDLLPDFLPAVGFTDDIALLTFVYGSIKQELEKFELWEMNRNINI